MQAGAKKITDLLLQEPNRNNPMTPMNRIFSLFLRGS